MDELEDLLVEFGILDSDEEYEKALAADKPLPRLGLNRGAPSAGVASGSTHLQVSFWLIRPAETG
jgi:hypothetical protein